MSCDIMYYSQSQTSLQGGYGFQNQQQQQQRPAFGSIHHQQQQEQPCGASFGFDGKLVQYFNVKREMGIGELPSQRLVTISKVVTLPEFVSRSDRLDYALESGTLGDFCQEKAQQVQDDSEGKIWQFLQASFSSTPNQSYLSILGFDSNELFSKLHHLHQASKDNETLTDSLCLMSVGRGDPDGYVGSHASQNGDIETDTAHKAGQTQEGEKNLIDIPVDESVQGLINQALLSGNTELAVDFCILHSRWEDALILASTGTAELIKKTQLKYFQKRPNETSSMIVAVVTCDLRRLVEHCDLRCWKEALATALTYSDSLGFPYLAETLGRRLGSSDDESLKKCALLCYICCGHINHLVDSWTSQALEASEQSDNPERLQEVVEQLMVLKKVGAMHGRESSHLDRILSEKLVKYGSLLISQGSLRIALKYISDSTDPGIVDLKHRVEYVLGTSRPAPSRQARSRQPSESSKYSLTKRPSYPIPAASQMSPDLGTSSYDRRTSSYVEPNISALTGPLIAPQPALEQTPSMDGGAGYFNPQNVNTAMSSPPNPMYGQQTSSASNYASGNTYSAYNPDRRPSTGTVPVLPPTSSVAWNDPPPFKAKPKPVAATQPAVEAIKHPIFGNAVPEPQPVYTPYAGGDVYSSNTPSGYPPAPPTGRPGQSGQYPVQTPYANPMPYSSHPLQPTSFGYAPPTGHGQTGPGGPYPMQTPYANPNPMSYSSQPPQPTIYPQAPMPQYGGMPPPPLKPMSLPPSISDHGSTFNPPPPFTSEPRQSFNVPPPSIPEQRSSFHGPPPSMAVQQSSFHQPALSKPEARPSFSGPPLSMPESGFRSSFYPSASMPEQQGMFNGPTPSMQESSFNAPPSSMSEQRSSFRGPTPCMPEQGSSFNARPPSMSEQRSSFHGPPPSMPDPQASFNAPPPSMSEQRSSFHGPPPSMPDPQSSFNVPPPRMPEPESGPCLNPLPPPSNTVPTEHEILPKVFEELRTACYNQAQPQVKRKLEDIARKLEILSEKLREGTLSAKTLSSMHSMVEALQRKDYQLALGAHTQLVTSGNFAEMSSFLPAIKVLIQTAAQLGVYI